MRLVNYLLVDPRGNAYQSGFTHISLPEETTLLERLGDGFPLVHPLSVTQMVLQLGAARHERDWFLYRHAANAPGLSTAAELVPAPECPAAPTGDRVMGMDYEAGAWFELGWASNPMYLPKFPLFRSVRTVRAEDYPEDPEFASWWMTCGPALYGNRGEFTQAAYEIARQAWDRAKNRTH